MTNNYDDKNSVKAPETKPEPVPADPKDEHVEDALATAEKDIAADADLSIHSPNDDLDEGELARLGEDNTDLV